MSKHLSLLFLARVRARAPRYVSLKLKGERRAVIFAENTGALGDGRTNERKFAKRSFRRRAAYRKAPVTARENENENTRGRQCVTAAALYPSSLCLYAASHYAVCVALY